MRLIQVVVIIVFFLLPVVMVANLFLSDDTSTMPILELEETETATLTTSTKASPQTSTIINESVKNDLERITIALPIDSEHLPTRLEPMGETINHDAKHGGHPGIDYQWESVVEPSKIYASAKGVIAEISYDEQWKWKIIIYHEEFDGEYYTLYNHLDQYDTNLEVGSQVEKHDFLGYPMHLEYDSGSTLDVIHWEFGKRTGERLGERLCPMTYFDEESRILIEEIWDSASYEFKDQFPKICSGFYDGKDE